MVKGIPEKGAEKWEESKKVIEDLCKDKLQVAGGIVHAHLVGARSNDWPKQMVVKMEWKTTKIR